MAAKNPFQKENSEPETEPESRIFEPAEAPEDGGKAEAEDEPESRIFGAKPEADAEEEEAEEDGAGKRQKPPPLGKQKRFQALKAQRDTAREEAAALRAENESAQNLQVVVQELYGRFENPLQEVRFDANLVRALLELNESDGEVARSVQKAVQFMQSGKLPQPEKDQPAAQAAAPKADPVVARILERDARRQVGELLDVEKIEPRFRKLIESHVLSHAQNLAELDDDEIAELAADWVRDSGFTQAELTGQKKSASRRAPVRASSGAASGGSARDSDAEEGGDGRPAPAKNLREWEKRKLDFQRAAFGGIQGQR